MPLIEYHCEGCGRSFERIVHAQDASPAEPPACPFCRKAGVRRSVGETSFMAGWSLGKAAGGAPPGAS